MSDGADREAQEQFRNRDESLRPCPFQVVAVASSGMIKMSENHICSSSSIDFMLARMKWGH